MLYDALGPSDHIEVPKRRYISLESRNRHLLPAASAKSDQISKGKQREEGFLHFGKVFLCEEEYHYGVPVRAVNLISFLILVVGCKNLILFWGHDNLFVMRYLHFALAATHYLLEEKDFLSFFKSCEFEFSSYSDYLLFL